MLHVPTFRQPDDVACLPTCVRAVLAFRGYPLSDEDASRLCQTDYEGTVIDLALSGLADAGLDADLHQFESVAELRELIADGQPVVTFLRHPSGSLHAVVVCDVTPSAVTVMDPGPGEYAMLPLSRFEDLWCRVQNEGIVVGRTAASASRP
ncbi:MAG: C39 family peptidase [Armatimonadetes bacterium]|nr:C39 family peptidase [Armatimonadota bacterium]